MHLERAAANGDLWARAQLEGPPCPESLAYLVGWAYELVGRSGVGMSGLAPLRYSEVEAWARVMGREVSPPEVEALMRLDRVLRSPPKDDGEEG